MPPAEHVHWLFAAGFLILGLSLLAEAIVGTEVWRRRAWRAYLWPTVVFLIGLFLWPTSVFYTTSTNHMLAHGSWAQVAMLAGAAQIGLVRGKLKSRYWLLTVALAMVVVGLTDLWHDTHPWLFQRSTFIHKLLGWALIGGAIFPIGQTFRPRSWLFNGGFAVLIIVAAVLLFADRDVAPIFGHLSPLAGEPRR